MKPKVVRVGDVVTITKGRSAASRDYANRTGTVIAYPDRDNQGVDYEGELRSWASVRFDEDTWDDFWVEELTRAVSDDEVQAAINSILGVGHE